MSKYFFWVAFMASVSAMERIEDNKPITRFHDVLPKKEEKSTAEPSQTELLKKISLMENEIKDLKENMKILMGQTGRWRTLFRADKPFQISCIAAIAVGVWRGDVIGAIYAGTIIYGALGSLFRGSSIVQNTISKNG